MKFRQFIQYNMRNIFVEKSYTQCVEETIPRSSSEKSKLTVYLWINSLKFGLIGCPVEGYENDCN